MEQIFIPLKEFQSLSRKVDLIETLIRRKLEKETPDLSQQWLTIDQVCKILRISRRTCQSYRDKGILPFSQHESKILFKKADIEKFLEENYKPAFNAKKRI